MRQIYLDYNATTPIAPSVFEAMRPFLLEHYGNPSSHHPFGVAAHQAVEDARQSVADALGMCGMRFSSRAAGRKAITWRSWGRLPVRTGTVVI